MNSAAAWNYLSGKKSILFHEDDTMIPLSLNLLQIDNTFCESVENNKSCPSDNPAQRKTSIIQLKILSPHAHMYPLTEMPRELQDVLTFVRSTLYEF
mmetsp:Transcript_11544/g.13259  ORF Transcript_11544/g.13259 Transcript_11544/m.13259 type:complete len:97 (-) Transcript_11544:449-739(-)